MNGVEGGWREILRRQENRLDAGLLERIGVARRRALAAAHLPWWRLHAPALGGAVLATVLAVAVLLPSMQQPLPQRGAGLPDDTVFYENLDFYLWLAESEMGAHD
ncbi:MAG: hypothetical protein H7A12_09880 [Pseudomonadales bacterium]|jgi:hypothetical protein|nr:hypothetical protein [Pseudomonadales bacterium]MCP5321117.1 hypothetical protein [Pseudomonadales bacterium]MCP5337277.1 hypothetical protein [Pseudomonadales bacterium]